MTPRMQFRRDRERRRMALFGLMLVAVMAMTLVAKAAQPDDLVTYTVVGTAQGSATADEAAVLPGFRLGVRGPLAGSSLDVLAALELTGSPGETVDLQDVATFKDARLDAQLLFRVGQKIRGKQVVRTNIFVAGGFATRLPHDPEPLLKYPRRFVAGVRVEDMTRGAWLSLALGRDDIAGASAWRQLCWDGELPVAEVKKGLDVIIGGRAVLTIFDRAGARDTFLAYVGVRKQ